MKKFFYTITATVLCLTACQKELSENVQPVQTSNPDMPTVTVPFTVAIPVSEVAVTKGDIDMAEKPVLQNLYIAVFGESGGMLQQLVPATLVGASLDQLSGVGYAYQAIYTAQLPLYNDECHLHFIGNYNGDTAELSFDYEKDFMDKLSMRIETTENGDYTTITSAPGAYWQKVILKDGIKATLQSDGTFELDNETKEKLTPIPLVRNYAKITVTSASSDFTINSYALINVPYQGTVAPYSATMGFDNHYMTIGGYCDGTTTTNFVDDLYHSGYVGYMADNDLIFTANPGESSAKTGAEEDNGLYMYERTIPTKAGEQTGVIVSLTWASNLEPTNPNYEYRGKTYYYKLEILNGSGEYMPICRNVHYIISLTSLTGEGYPTFDGAFAGPFFGNVSSSIETATLTDINDNIHRIVVNRMDYTSVTGEDEVDIYFQYYPDLTANASTSTSNYKANEILEVTPYNQAIASVSSVELISDSSDAWFGWMHVTVTLKSKPTDGSTLRGKLRVQGLLDSGVGNLYRDIVFTVMSTQDFTSESTLESNGTNVTVNIGIPTGLSYSLFPLQIKIESQNNNLTTTSADLPVGYGPSAFDSTKNSFYFIKTIQYKDYVDTSTGEYVYTTQFPCSFTNTDTYKVLSVQLNDMEGYFNSKTL